MINRLYTSGFPAHLKTGEQGTLAELQKINLQVFSTLKTAPEVQFTGQSSFSHSANLLHTLGGL